MMDKVMQFASEKEIKHLRSLINRDSSSKEVDTQDVQDFYSILFGVCERLPQPYLLKKYANEEEPMPRETYQRLIEAKLNPCD
ncbi:MULTISPECIES: hypothetical protein [Aeromonas]|uniref:hypothetical protein n=1 Tax=Aeromonas TaxID=642 RepID=UPI000953B55B|nr:MULTISPECIES: hypothetical protein [Aeromonas]MDX7852974.1 hypothetical protein [Aeromonas caviae]SIP88296.1 hypothetical protein SAMN05878295_10178 [Aeromonas hydrophila]SIR30603.1 hypothetical protein SAMN05880569_11223 [Aeromonas hydrophila]